MHDNLSEYGYTFQLKVISSLLTDKPFLQQVSDIIDPNYFESQANNWIVEKIIEFHNSKSPSEILDLQSNIRSIYLKYLSPSGFFSNFNKILDNEKFK
jgi:replicative DNA helicase